MNCRILIACHKSCAVPEDDLYLPMQVGASGKESIGFQRDDEGDNISAKNALFCELTGLYWCWKNLDSDYLGLSHYRRYFTLKSRAFQKKNGALRSVLTGQECETLLKDHKVIVPKKRHYFIETVYDHYSHTFSEEHLIRTRETLQELSPEYLPSFEKVMHQRSVYIFNMFIMPRDLVNSYCEWLFPVLSSLEKKVDTSSMSDFEKRYIGRISERLFNVWLHHELENGYIKKEEILEVPYLYIGKVKWTKKIIGFLSAKILHKKYTESF